MKNYEIKKNMRYLRAFEKRKKHKFKFDRKL